VQQHTCKVPRVSAASAFRAVSASATRMPARAATSPAVTRAASDSTASSTRRRIAAGMACGQRRELVQARRTWPGERRKQAPDSGSPVSLLSCRQGRLVHIKPSATIVQPYSHSAGAVVWASAGSWQGAHLDL